jgi:hypothetical protein
MILLVHRMKYHVLLVHRILLVHQMKYHVLTVFFCFHQNHDVFGNIIVFEH